jgi:hypothetical protein
MSIQHAVYVCFYSYYIIIISVSVSSSLPVSVPVASRACDYSSIREEQSELFVGAVGGVGFGSYLLPAFCDYVNFL